MACVRTKFTTAPTRNCCSVLQGDQDYPHGIYSLSPSSLTSSQPKSKKHLKSWESVLVCGQQPSNRTGSVPRQNMKPKGLCLIIPSPPSRLRARVLKPTRHCTAPPTAPHAKGHSVQAQSCGGKIHCLWTVCPRTERCSLTMQRDQGTRVEHSL